MTYGLGPSPFPEAMSAQDMMQELGEHIDVEVTVNDAGTLIDVCRATYDPDRDKIVLHPHPDDLDDALRKLLRRTPAVDWAAERAAGERSES